MKKITEVEIRAFYKFMKIWQRIKLEYIFCYYLIKVYLFVLKYYFKFYFMNRKKAKTIKQHLELKAKLERLWYLTSYMDLRKKKSTEKELKEIDRKMGKEEKGLVRLSKNIDEEKKYFFRSIRLLLAKMKNCRAELLSKLKSN